MTDLQNAARSRFRKARSPRYTIRHKANPHLRQYDALAVTDPTWQHAARVGYAAGFRPTFDVGRTGSADQDTVVVFPLEAYDPEAA